MDSCLSKARTALPVAVKLTVVLDCHVAGSFQAAAGEKINISQFEVHCWIRNISEALQTPRNRLISFPFARDKQAEQTQELAQTVGFSVVQDANDYVNIALHVPHVNLAIFMNQNGYHSLKVQLLCNHRQCIMQENAHYPGSSHNSFILRQSYVSPVFDPPRQVKDWLLGDKGSPLVTWLMTPVQNPCTSARQAYNESHVATRNIIEHIIGILKQQFRCLDLSGGALQYSAEHVTKSVVVCWMLHSLAIQREQLLPPPTRRGAEEDE
uniref:putative nuclease HARBI1 n=1 Tax=Pristiophorus japonicus TaxID=55135 RepID=UPI00398EE88D